jgi:hypothetical protein
MVEVCETNNFSIIVFLFVRKYAGIMGNERADRHAGTAVISDGRAIDNGDVLHALREVERIEDSLRDGDSRDTLLNVLDTRLDGCVCLGVSSVQG